MEIVNELKEDIVYYILGMGIILLAVAFGDFINYYRKRNKSKKEKKRLKSEDDKWFIVGFLLGFIFLIGFLKNY